MSYKYNEDRDIISKFIDTYEELKELGYKEHFIIDRLEDNLILTIVEEELDELPDLLQLKDDLKDEIHRIEGLTEDQKQEISCIVRDAIHAYE